MSLDKKLNMYTSILVNLLLHLKWTLSRSYCFQVMLLHYHIFHVNAGYSVQRLWSKGQHTLSLAISQVWELWIIQHPSDQDGLRDSWLLSIALVNETAQYGEDIIFVDTCIGHSVFFAWKSVNICFVLFCFLFVFDARLDTWNFIDVLIFLKYLEIRYRRE